MNPSSYRTHCRRPRRVRELNARSSILSFANGTPRTAPPSRSEVPSISIAEITALRWRSGEMPRRRSTSSVRRANPPDVASKVPLAMANRLVVDRREQEGGVLESVGATSIRALKAAFDASRHSSSSVIPVSISRRSITTSPMPEFPGSSSRSLDRRRESRSDRSGRRAATLNLVESPASSATRTIATAKSPNPNPPSSSRGRSRSSESPSTRSTSRAGPSHPGAAMSISSIRTRESPSNRASTIVTSPPVIRSSWPWTTLWRIGSRTIAATATSAAMTMSDLPRRLDQRREREVVVVSVDRGTEA